MSSFVLFTAAARASRAPQRSLRSCLSRFTQLFELQLHGTGKSAAQVVHFTQEDIKEDGCEENERPAPAPELCIRTL